MTTTYEQAKRLKEIGFNEETHCEYRTPVVRKFENGKAKYVRRDADLFEITGRSGDSYYGVSYENSVSAPSISDALQWIRDNKGVICAVEICHHEDISGMRTYYKQYRGIYIQLDFEDGYTDEFESYPKAESALLNELLDYLEGRGR